MPRHTFHLALRKSKNYPHLMAKIHRKKPAIGPGEVLLALDVNVPDALFDRPVLRAKIDVPDLPSERINAEVMANIGKALSDQFGLRVEIEPFKE